MKSDIEIARSSKQEKITLVAKKLGLGEEDIIMYGDNKAKIKDIKKVKSNSKLILVTAINPTPFGEGKTTVSIGLGDALCSLGKKSLMVLREPSLGPVFGIKGGATGGGMSQIVPMDEINLHFTGDFHAITTANNLLCAAIDNSLFFDNPHNIDPKKIIFKRCMDMNDRSLREIKIGINNCIQRTDGFNITAASEIMAIFCLTKNIEDLRKRLESIIVGYTFNDEPVYAKDLNVVGSMLVTLKDAIKPNLVQTLENNPVLIHGGPFANIAHGCNTIIATNLGLSLADYVVTEAGFGADLGAEKFFDIKCRLADLKPNVVVLVATIKALKYNGGVLKDEITLPNIKALKEGLCNLEAHLNNLALFGVNIVVALNKYQSDTIEEIKLVQDFVESKNISFAISEAYIKGSEGALSLAKEVIKLCDTKNNFNFLYDLNLNIQEKINTIAKNIYHAGIVNYSNKALKDIKLLEKLNKTNLPICIAKTQYSLSDDPKKLGYPKDYEITVKEVQLNNGAGFLVVILGEIMRMPGLGRNSAYKEIDLDKDNNIIGLF